MTIEQPKENKQTSLHSLHLDTRRHLRANGILKTVSYDEYSVTLETDCGTLLIGGEGLCVNEISTQTGEVIIEGNIEYLQYQNKAKKSQSGDGFFKRLVR
ncbi:MAG: YabP/YqfC family sporulation protein [Oscillospiraceae bacterium]